MSEVPAKFPTSHQGLPVSGSAHTAAAPRIVAFGEVLLRLSPQHRSRIAQARAFDACHGGAEANVAAALARWGNDARFVTRLPQNPLGDAALASLRSTGMDTSHVSRGAGRMGLYWFEQGAAPRRSSVVYDRSGSAFTKLDAAELEWETILDGAAWLHVSGITPALGEGSAACVDAAMRTARARDVTVSFDINYRARLWSAPTAARVLAPLISLADVLITNISDPVALFGIGSGLPDESVARALATRFPNLRSVALSVHAVSDDPSVRAGLVVLRGGGLLEGAAWHVSPVHAIDVADPVGAGDAFAAGLIHATLHGATSDERIRYAAAAAALALTMPGDMLLADEREVREVMNADVRRGVRR